MKLRNSLLVLAALLAGASLLLAGREVAHRFWADASVLDLLFPIAAVATAIVCLVVLDYVRNVSTDALVRGGRQGRGEDDEDEEEGERRHEADSELVEALHALNALANEEQGADKTVEDALRVVARAANAATVELWTAEQGGALAHQAAFADGEIAFGDDPAEPVDQEALTQAFERRKPFEAVGEERARFLCPLVCHRRCIGVLKVTAPVAGTAEQRQSTARALSTRLSHLARPFGRAMRAPELYDQAVVDHLTGLYTRRHFVNRLTEATGASRRYGEPMALLLLDVDNFGMLNDRYGRETADRALADVASLVQDNIRDCDSAYRYGPDAFAVILPATDLDHASRVAERLRSAARAVRPVAEAGGSIILSVSGGIAEFDEDMRGIGPLMAHAEQALLRAKGAGHDRVVVWTDDLGADDEP